MKELMVEWRKYINEDESAVDLSEPPISGRTSGKIGDRPIEDDPVEKRKQVQLALAKFSGLLRIINEKLAGVSDLRWACMLHFINRRTKDLTVGDIPNGSKKFEELTAKFWQPILNGDLNLTDPTYISRLEGFLKTGKFRFDLDVNTMLEKYFNSPTTGWTTWIAGAARGAAEDYRMEKELQKNPSARFFSPLPVVEIHHAIGRYNMTVQNNMASIIDPYDFEDGFNKLEAAKSSDNKIRSGEYGIDHFIENVKDTIRSWNDQKSTISSIKMLAKGEGQTSSTLYGLMFEFAALIHAGGYPGYKMNFQFPIKIEKERIKYNIERLKKAAKEQDSAAERAQRQQYDKEQGENVSKSEVTPYVAGNWKPTICTNDSQCKGSKCIDFGSKSDITVSVYKYAIQNLIKRDGEAEVRKISEDLSTSDVLGMYYFLNKMSVNQVLEARKFANKVCLQMELVLKAKESTPIGSTTRNEEYLIRQLLVVHMQTYARLNSFKYLFTNMDKSTD